MAVAVTLAGLMIAASAIPMSSPRDRATAWAKSLSAAERQMYTQGDRLDRIPAEYRKAVFKTLSTADERIGFWQSVFTTYRRQHVISAAQDATLKKAEAMIPVMFRGLPAERKKQEAALALVSQEVKLVLGSQGQEELFLTAGAHGRTDGLPIAERAMLRAHGWSRTNLVARAAARIAPTVFAAGDCNCNASQNDCYYSQTCTAGLNGCTNTGGCACSWLIFNCWTCDGLCNYGY
jgi:hypothetical protein